MRISDGSSDVCSSDLAAIRPRLVRRSSLEQSIGARLSATKPENATAAIIAMANSRKSSPVCPAMNMTGTKTAHTTSVVEMMAKPRSEEHTSELQSLMRISYAVFCLKKKIQI